MLITVGKWYKIYANKENSWKSYWWVNNEEQYFYGTPILYLGKKENIQNFYTTEKLFILFGKCQDMPMK